MIEKFIGFDLDTLHFYTELSLNNNRDWLESNIF